MRSRFQSPERHAGGHLPQHLYRNGDLEASLLIGKRIDQAAIACTEGSYTGTSQRTVHRLRLGVKGLHEMVAIRHELAGGNCDCLPAGIEDLRTVAAVRIAHQ